MNTMLSTNHSGFFRDLISHRVFGALFSASTAVPVTLLILLLMSRLIYTEYKLDQSPPVKIPPIIYEPSEIEVQEPAPPIEVPKVETPPPSPPSEFDYNNDQSINVAVTPPSVGKGVDFDLTGDLDGAAVIIVRIAPEYPPRAAARGIEGFVDLLFDISPAGRPINIRVQAAEPSSIFNKAAMRALSSWKYRAKTVDGQAVVQYGQQTRMRFLLDKKA